MQQSKVVASDMTRHHLHLLSESFRAYFPLIRYIWRFERKLELLKYILSSEQEVKQPHTDLGRLESHMLNVSDLLPGDILLHRPRNPGCVQKTISFITNSPYTHASIYVGKDTICESVRPKVRRRNLFEELEDCRYIAVLRSQAVFSEARTQNLLDFLNSLIVTETKYDFIGAMQTDLANNEHFNELDGILRNEYFQAKSRQDFIDKGSYFCSALVVASYSVVGIVGDTAQVVYPNNIFSPADLYRDNTFGWFLGYIVPYGQEVAGEDPLGSHMSWQDVPEACWWV